MNSGALLAALGSLVQSCDRGSECRLTSASDRPYVFRLGPLFGLGADTFQSCIVRACWLWRLISSWPSRSPKSVIVIAGPRSSSREAFWNVLRAAWSSSVELALRVCAWRGGIAGCRLWFHEHPWLWWPTVPMLALILSLSLLAMPPLLR